MEIFRHILEDKSPPILPCVLTMGNFDGIHLGHQALLRNAVDEARRQKCESVVLTFEPHPLRVLAPNRAPRLILAHKDKVQLIQSFGVDVMVIQTFDAQFASMEADEFVRKYLVDRLRIRKLWVGKDLRFGKGRRGSVENLVRWGADSDFDVGIVEPILFRNARISSSRIRQMIERGEVDQVEPMLGRYHFVSGRVVSGHRRGREFGFPTANVQARTEVIPLDGVYATLLQIGGRHLRSVTNVGVNPTFGEGARTVESFILDFDGQIYGEPVKVFFVRRIREEKKFATAALLVDQMKQDVTVAQEILQGVRTLATVESER
jgi:riboflavin kinase / FMN adenylyltransferase